MSMYALHEALQIAFGWTERHSFQFDFEQPDNGLDAEDFMSDTSGCYWEERYLIVDPAKIRRYRRKGGVVRPAHECSVQTLIGDPSLSGRRSIYRYDLTEEWDHDFKLVGFCAPSKDFHCISGTGHPVAERCGGPGQWEELKEIYTVDDEELDADDKEFRDWFENEAPNGDRGGLRGQRSHRWNMSQVNRELKALTPGIQEREKRWKEEYLQRMQRIAAAEEREDRLAEQELAKEVLKARKLAQKHWEEEVRERTRLMVEADEREEGITELVDEFLDNPEITKEMLTELVERVLGNQELTEDELDEDRAVEDEPDEDRAVEDWAVSGWLKKRSRSVFEDAAVSGAGSKRQRTTGM